MDARSEPTAESIDLTHQPSLADIFSKSFGSLPKTSSANIISALQNLLCSQSYLFDESQKSIIRSVAQSGTLLCQASTHSSEDSGNDTPRGENREQKDVSVSIVDHPRPRKAEVEVAHKEGSERLNLAYLLATNPIDEHLKIIGDYFVVTVGQPWSETTRKIFETLITLENPEGEGGSVQKYINGVLDKMCVVEKARNSMTDAINAQNGSANRYTGFWQPSA